MEKFIIPNTSNDASIEKTDKNLEINSSKIDSEENKYDDEIPEDLRERAEEVLEEYGREKENKPATQEEISDLIKKQSSNEEEKNAFENFLENKFGAKSKMGRRAFLAGTVSVVAGLAINHKYLIENFKRLWDEFIEQRENNYEIEYSEELTKLYKESKEMPARKYDIEKQKLNIDILEEHFNFFEQIQNSEKKPLSEFINILSETEFDNLSFGVRHNLSPEVANKIIKKLDELGKQFAEFDFEGLSFTEESDVEAVKKFNMNELTTKEMASHIQENVESLIDTAREKSINISGTELNKGFDRPTGYGRFTYLSERMKEAMKRNDNKGIVVFYGGGAHVTKDTWNFSKRRFSQDYNDALKKNYTIKESLEKEGYKSVAVIIEDMEHYELEDISLGDVYENLPKEKQEEFYEKMIKLWKNYLFESNEPFVSKYPEGEEDSFSVIVPTKVPPMPPHLNGYKTAYSNDRLSEILNKFPLRTMKRNSKNIELYISIDNKEVPFLTVDGETGNVTKIYFPKQSKE